jgi:hypothetical protein
MQAQLLVDFLHVWREAEGRYIETALYLVTK